MIRSFVQRLGQRYPNCPFEQLDPRCKLLIVLTVTVMVIFGNSIFSAGLFIATGIVALLVRLTKMFILVSFLSIILWLVFMFLFNFVVRKPLDDPQAMFFGMVFRGGTLVTIGFWFAVTTKLRDMTSALEAWKVPPIVILPLTIAVRFIPTLLNESLVIRDSMKLRRIAHRKREFFKRPHLIGHSYLALVIIRSLKMADELAAVAETRGLARQGIRNAYRPARFKINDYYAIGVLLTLVALLTILTVVM